MRLRWLVMPLLAALGFGCARETRDGVIHLRYASPYPQMHPFSRADRTFIDQVQAAAHGRLQIETFWSGSLLTAEQSLIELRHGVADLGVISPIYARGGAHALRTQTAFYAGAESFDRQVGVYKCLAREFPGLNRELTGMTVLAVQGGHLPGVFTRNRAVRDLRDLTGLRLRAPAELMQLFETLGADPVNMPMGEVYSALAKGVIDGVVAPTDTLRALHLAEVGHFFTRLSIARGAYPARAISDAAMKKLPADLQRLLLDAGPSWEAALSREIDAAADSGERFGLEHGVQFVELAPGEQEQFDSLYNAAALESAKTLSKRGVDGPSMFRRAQQLIREEHAAATTSPCPG
jgi:TRAP-type C4-dicarboxylate transport system substrate-binding protein